MKYLVVGAEGPGFASPEEAVEVLEGGILPTFDALMQLEEDEKILAGGSQLGIGRWYLSLKQRLMKS